MAYEIWKIEGFNPNIFELKDGDFVFYVKRRQSPNIKLSLGKYYNSKGSSETGDYEPWYVVDFFDGKKRYPYTSELIPIDKFEAANVKTTWVVTDNHYNTIKENK